MDTGTNDSTEPVIDPYEFLKGMDEVVICWYLTIEVEYGKPPYLTGSYHAAGIPIDNFEIEELKAGPDSRIRLLTSGLLCDATGTFRTWDEVDEFRRSGNFGFYKKDET